MNKMYAINFAISIFVLTASCGNLDESAAQSSNHAGDTGICYRRVVALVDNKTIVTRHESIISVSSGKLDVDIERMRYLESTVRPLRDPHTRQNTWIGAWFGEGGFTNVEGPDCSLLQKTFDPK